VALSAGPGLMLELRDAFLPALRKASATLPGRLYPE
jgi:hypothetical protein